MPSGERRMRLGVPAAAEPAEEGALCAARVEPALPYPPGGVDSGMNSPPRTILHLDMDAFFAAVEQARRPELAGKPLVVGGRGDPQQRGVVSTASYEARKYGIHSAMPLRTAYKLCPEAVFLPVDYREYSRVSALIKAILRGVSPAMEDTGIDEAYLDISALDRPPEQVASDIKGRIREATGLTCSIGIAPNKLLAKIASDLEKPDGLTVIREADLEARLWPLGVRKLPGVGPKTEARLQRMGIRTIGELARARPEELAEAFGPSHGQWLWEAAHGIDERPLVTHWEPKSMSRELTFQRDVGHWQTLAKTLAGLVRTVAGDLRAEGYLGRVVTVKLRYADFETHTREKTLERPTDSAYAIRRAAFDCLARFGLEKAVRLIGVRVGGLQKTAESPGRR
jgi:DNA polymerase-4